MANISHKNLTGNQLHEPKGADTASDGDVYVSDGAGSGTWEHPAAHFGGYVSFDAATPAYQHSMTTSDTVLDPTFLETSSTEFSSTDTPNARFTYTGSDARDAFFMFNCSMKQNSGSNKDVEFVIYKNGVAQDSSRVIRTASTASWGSVSLHWDNVVSQNDYFEVFIKGSGATTIDFAQMYLGVLAVTN